MKQEYFGTESITDEDRGYNGSRFAEVRDALFANPYQELWGRDGQGPLPIYQVTLSSVLRGILSFGRRYLFQQATARAVDSLPICAGARTGKALGACCTRTA